ncbi:disease resistance protein RGA2-like [Vigna umbellata]|uniref:disease resistance protein RGA2-like n=1 Tax=Vigna umbellata TaxID=87088 RepID=UPI001F5F0973|nr:disease resistance protein RGA2-like [Vigna umbellata]
MAGAILKIVLENLNSLEVGLCLGFNLDMKRLASLLTTIKETLEDAEQKQLSNRAVKDWLEKLKDAAHVLDDILDEFAYESLRLEHQGVKCGPSNKVQRSCLSSIHPKNVAFRCKIAKKMKKITERLEEIAEGSTNFHFTKMEMFPWRNSAVTEWHQTKPFITDSKVYGREGDTDKFIDFLTGYVSHSENASVYTIVGEGGLGKTTLAKLIFKHERIINHFELRIWVRVSEDFRLKSVIKAIIEVASRHPCEDMDIEPLQIRLDDLLQRKRYLLVLDDVWIDELESWSQLKYVLLSCGAKGSSILVTTRLPNTVAASIGTVPPHVLSRLSDNDCWEIFKEHAFGLNEVEKEVLVATGMEIVKKCRGVPLAVKIMGGMFSFKREQKEWLYVKESNLWSLPQHEKNSVIPILRLSYLDLPMKLRQCFAYCARFPKGETISKEDLIEQWMANGFIPSSETFDAEDTGDSMWNELYWRSFFQDIETDELGKVKTFQIHDPVHDLTQFLAEDVCCIAHDKDVTTLSDTIHHLADHRAAWDVSEESINSMQLHQVKSLRTYIGQLYPVVFKCYSLRVLWCTAVKELSNSICHLKHLRYLNLSQGNFKTLPESLGKLWNLHILKLDYCYRLKQLPNRLTRLKALQQLSLKDCYNLSSLPPHLGKLTSLKKLSAYLVGSERGFHLAELGSLHLKGYLHIKHLEKVKSVTDAKEANMSNKQLHKLYLSWDENEESELQQNVEEILEALQPDTQQLQNLTLQGYKGENFPLWLSSSSSLKDLAIVGCRKFILSSGFRCVEDLLVYRCKEVEHLHESLQRMSSLHSLRLWDLPNVESLSGCFANLPLLQSLSLLDLPKLKSLPDCFGRVPLLRSLTLRDLPNVESLPDCFGNFRLLREMVIGDCSKLACLPKSLNLKSLEKVEIYNCPSLYKRREEEN